MYPRHLHTEKVPYEGDPMEIDAKAFARMVVQEMRS